MNRFLTTVLSLFLATGTAVAQRYSGGSGTESKPFKISTRADLEMLATVINTQGRSYADTCFLLTKDVEGVTTIIGCMDRPASGFDRPFKGVFDGGGHKVTVNIDTVLNTYYGFTAVGLFGRMEDGVIKNLGVDGRISVTRVLDELGVPLMSFSTTGAICGYASGNALIDNCYNEAEIYVRSSSTTTSGLDLDLVDIVPYSSGICGQAHNGVTVNNCYNEGKIDVANSASGVCGLADSAVVSNCRNSGEVTGGHLGGVCYIARAGSLISGCCNTADISSDLISTVSGICSQANASNIINCYNTGNLSSSGSVCGIVSHLGWVREEDGRTYIPYFLSRCYNTGNLSGDEAAGIFIYSHSNTVSNCYNTGKITAGSRAGGIGVASGIGQTNATLPYTEPYTYIGEVTDCYNTGDVTVYNKGYTNVAGIVAMGGNISNCYSSGNVLATYPEDVHNSVAFVGGICAQAGGRITNCVVTSDSIYSKRGAEDSYIGRIIGGLPSAGELAHVTLENCHAKASLLLNGATLSSGDATSWNGKDLANPAEILSAVETLSADSLVYGDMVDMTTDKLSVTFRSSDPEVAEVSGNTLLARKTGEATVTANFAWSEEDYFQMSFPKTVGKRDLHISAGEHSRPYGEPNPAFALSYAGFANGDDESALNELPAVSCQADETSPVGSYELVLSGGSDDNYNCIPENGVLQITARQTGIKVLTTAGADNEKPVIYDLLGRKVSATSTQKGVYLLKQGSKTIKIIR
jgi:hypothetical protein